MTPPLFNDDLFSGELFKGRLFREEEEEIIVPTEIYFPPGEHRVHIPIPLRSKKQEEEEIILMYMEMQ
jgi:hypothetical protein